ncbi:MAG TPA: tetratricopeptide repeat protein [Candidatus Marinimicrobia bacterium]|nr:tetratricopeptide repeat protein [Candidatus Neomarinimicrobiota bacterium]
MTKRRNSIITIIFIISAGLLTFLPAQELDEDKKISYEALHQLAREAIKNEDFQSAADFFEAILKKYPEDADAMLALGRLNGWQGNFAKAEELLFLTVRLYPDYDDAWQALGDIYFWQDKHQLAVNAYMEWEKRAPTLWEPSIKRAKAEIAIRRNNTARQSIESARMLGAPKEMWEPLLKSIQQN